MSFRDAHIVLGWVVVVTNGLAGVWALAAHWQEQLRSGALWVLTAVAQSLIVVQIIVGVIDLQRRDLDVAGLHLFYGFIAMAAVGIIYSYRQQVERWLYLLYGFGGLFLMGLAIRALLIPAVLPT